MSKNELRTVKEAPWNDEQVIPDDVFTGEDHHPVCCFFELFPSSQDPYEKYYDTMFCHMTLTETPAEKCKGDYLKCPLIASDPPEACEELLEACENLENDDGAIPEHAWQMVQTAITKAKGE